MKSNLFATYSHYSLMRYSVVRVTGGMFTYWPHVIIKKYVITKEESSGYVTDKYIKILLSFSLFKEIILVN